jgi:hypothetical protein
MNVLYKYCDRVGVEKILETLELMLPYISEVNDPLECKPCICKQGGTAAMEEQCRRSLRRKGREPSANWREVLQKKIQRGEDSKLQQNIAEDIDNMKRRSCLLSVSKTARNTVMWAHYTEKHKGGVIGFDFEYYFRNMEPVRYSKQRPKLNIWDIGSSKEKYFKTLITKSSEWKYEKEYRQIVDDSDLRGYEKNGLACIKDFNGKKTWFLRLNPESIKEVIFGLYAEDGLKSAIKKLIERPELRHVKLYQTEESETYTLNLVEIKNR